MTFGESIKTCFQRYAAFFSGRASRSEFWWFYLFLVILVGLLLVNRGTTAPLSNVEAILGAALLLLLLVAFFPALSVWVRRLHDVDWRGWWVLFPVINVVLTFFPGTQGENRFGPDPLAQDEEPSS